MIHAAMISCLFFLSRKLLSNWNRERVFVVVANVIFHQQPASCGWIGATGRIL